MRDEGVVNPVAEVLEATIGDKRTLIPVAAVLEATGIFCLSSQFLKGSTV